MNIREAIAIHLYVRPHVLSLHFSMYLHKLQNFGVYTKSCMI